MTSVRPLSFAIKSVSSIQVFWARSVFFFSSLESVAWRCHSRGGGLGDAVGARCSDRRRRRAERHHLALASSVEHLFGLVKVVGLNHLLVRVITVRLPPPLPTSLKQVEPTTDVVSSTVSVASCNRLQSRKGSDPFHLGFADVFRPQRVVHVVTIKRVDSALWINVFGREILRSSVENVDPLPLWCIFVWSAFCDFDRIQGGSVRVCTYVCQSELQTSAYNDKGS